MTGVEYKNGRGEDKFSSSAGILKRHDILINIIPSQKCMGRKLTKVLISCMEKLGRRVAAIMALAVSGLIFLYSLV